MNAADIRVALMTKFAPPEYALVFEVAQSTGWKANRHLDAVAMHLWPCRGLTLHGIEIKTSRADFRRELADPTKAEEVARFCDRFWIAAPGGVVSIDDLPAAWGLLGLGASGKLEVAKPATKTPAEPVTRDFLAAMLRASTRGITT